MDSQPQLPDGYFASALSPDGASPIRLAVVVRREPEPQAGRLVTLRVTADARVLLGCVIDAIGRPREWIEIWIQQIGDASLLTARNNLIHNVALDARWLQNAVSFRTFAGRDFISTGWERQHPRPTWIDVRSEQVISPLLGEANHPWTLCTDDGLLEASNLPAYSSTLHRYLWAPALDVDSPLCPVTPQAPNNEHTQSLDSVMPPSDHIEPLNPAGGLMMVKRLHPLSIDQFLGVLAGRSWDGLPHGRTSLQLGFPGSDALTGAGQADAPTGRLFMGAHGRWGRLIENLHLKLRMFTDAVAATARLTELTGKPLLNLTADKFRTSLGETGAGLPHLWTATTTLTEPGDAVTLSLPASKSTYFLPVSPDQRSVYRPEDAGRAAAGEGVIRIRKVNTDLADGVVIEGTFATEERMSPADHDLLWLRLNVGSDPLDVFGRLQPDQSLAAGEWRLRSTPQSFDDATINQLQAAEGVPLSRTPFSVFPMLTSPVDMYALAVLAVRILLVNPQTTLAESLDEMLSLARQAAPTEGNQTDLPTRIGRVFDRDARWLPILGPHRLTDEEIAPEDAFDLIPPDLWRRCLAAIIRLFPGIGSDSLCRDYGDAPADGLHRIYQPALAELESLLVSSRSLIVIDWRFNREIQGVIRRFRAGMVSRPHSQADSPDHSPPNPAADLPKAAPPPAGMPVDHADNAAKADSKKGAS